jgi:hypothetical protein
MNSKLIILLCLSFFYSRNLFPQGAVTNGMGEAVTAISVDMFSNASNPAGDGLINNRQAIVDISPYPYGLKELATYSFGYIEPSGIGNFAISMEIFGYDLFKRYTPAISFSKNLFDDLLLGIKLHYEYYNIKNYGSAGCLGIDVGSIVKITKDLNWGFSISNVNSPTLGQEKEKLEHYIRMGIGWKPLDNFLLDLDFHKDVRYPALLCFGLDYRMIKYFSFRAGINSEPSTITTGFSIYYSSFVLDYALTFHNELGETHFFALHYLFNK